MQSRWVILDMMGVIFEVGDDTNDLLVPYVRRHDPSQSPERINALYLRASLGRISARQFWEALGLGERYPGIERTYLDSQLRLDPGFREAAVLLSGPYRLAILSNDVVEWSAYLRARHGLEDLFRASVISGEVHVRKPDKGIYEALLGRIGAPPADCVLVDDRDKNLRPAAELGMRTVRFAREAASGVFAADAEIASFAELPAAVQRVFAMPD